ncbi:hypothetical protein WJX73_006040 [Symbiochloris irregularis]|uniref:Uncharacterized protein n=1 Tax=Symbiochloris irregularis TaxID=706552 RepID=A0AAW1NS92_9CHLO
MTSDGHSFTGSKLQQVKEGQPAIAVAATDALKAGNEPGQATGASSFMRWCWPLSCCADCGPSHGPGQQAFVAPKVQLLERGAAGEACATESQTGSKKILHVKELVQPSANLMPGATEHGPIALY